MSRNWRHTIFLVFLGCAVSMCLPAQDIHFSQFFFAPQILNPAEIGNFDAKYRANANQKTQWKQVSKPYNTFAMSADGGFSFLPEAIDVGAVILNDRAGDSRLNTFSLLLGGSYSYQLPGTNNHRLRGGVQVGLSQLSLDDDALNFDNQHNGFFFDSNLPTGERFARNSRWYTNLNLGLTYTYFKAARAEITGGYSLHNLNRPDQSFFNDFGVNLGVRHSLYATSTWAVSGDIDLLPTVRWMSQSTFSEFVIGAAVRYILLDERSLYRTLFAGYFGRINDSGIAMVGMEIDAWRFAASYDINLSDLEVASRNRGGLEFSLQYLFNRDRNNPGFRHKYCPVYI